MKEFFQNLFDTSKERINNPFIGSYIIAFILFNWRAFSILLFSEATIECKIIAIDKNYTSFGAIGWPLAITLFYILFLPYLNLLFDSILLYSNNKKESRLRSKAIQNLTQKKSEAKLEREIAEERAGTSEISHLKIQIEQLKKENNDLVVQNKEAFDRYSQSQELATQNEDGLKQSLEKIRSEYDELLSQQKKSGNITQMSVIDLLTESQKKYLIEYGDYQFLGKSPLRLADKMIERFYELGIINKPNIQERAPNLTLHGEKLYNSIKR